MWRTDRQTDILSRHSPHYAYRTRRTVKTRHAHKAEAKETKTLQPFGWNSSAVSCRPLDLTGIIYANIKNLLCNYIFPFPHFIHSSVTQFVNMILFHNIWTNFDANWHKWCTKQQHKAINFGGQEVNGHGHRRPKIDLQAWCRHHSSTLLGWVGFIATLIINQKWWFMLWFIGMVDAHQGWSQDRKCKSPFKLRVLELHLGPVRRQQLWHTLVHAPCNL